MENNLEKNEKINNNSKDIKNQLNKSDSLIKFFEDYYGYFKQFISKDDLFKIGKINRKIMSLIIIDKGNYLYCEKETKKDKLKKIINVSIYIYY
jgi:hypothetical protein